MDFLNDFLPILLLFLGAVLLVVLIILLLKVIKTVDKVNIILDDVEQKSQSLNGLFKAIERLGNALDSANNKVTGFVAGVAKKMFKQRKSKKAKKEEEENE